MAIMPSILLLVSNSLPCYVALLTIWLNTFEVVNIPESFWNTGQHLPWGQPTQNSKGINASVITISCCHPAPFILNLLVFQRSSFLLVLLVGIVITLSAIIFLLLLPCSPVYFNLPSLFSPLRSFFLHEGTSGLAISTNVWLLIPLLCFHLH